MNFRKGGAKKRTAAAKTADCWPPTANDHGIKLIDSFDFRFQ
jgi:hypothetical protein